MVKPTNINNRRYLENKYKLLPFIKNVIDAAYDSVLSKVHKLFEVEKVHFDIDWREKFMGEIV